MGNEAALNADFFEDEILNEATLIIDAKSENEALARVFAASFMSSLDPTVSEISDVKLAVSEAVTNAVIHGYEEKEGKIYINCKLIKDTVFIEVKDDGRGIEDIKTAREPLYTSKPKEERSGMGFTVMETFTDGLEVYSKPGEGTAVVMRKKLSS
jgi:stage II sporulation protein AB (anti-sigma F factor)